MSAISPDCIKFQNNSHKFKLQEHDCNEKTPFVLLPDQSGFSYALMKRF